MGKILNLTIHGEFVLVDNHDKTKKIPFIKYRTRIDNKWRHVRIKGSRGKNLLTNRMIPGHFIISVDEDNIIDNGGNERIKINCIEKIIYSHYNPETNYFEYLFKQTTGATNNITHRLKHNEKINAPMKFSLGLRERENIKNIVDGIYSAKTHINKYELCVKHDSFITYKFSDIEDITKVGDDKW